MKRADARPPRPGRRPPAVVPAGGGWTRALLAVAVVAAVVAFAFQGTRGLYASSETRYAECAREMLVSGNWLEPTLAGRPHWSKPPLTYWAIAGGMTLLGRNEWGVRLYGAGAFVATAALVAALGRAMWDARTGLAAGLIYATSPFAAAGANAATTDVLLTLWEALTVLAYWRARRAAEGERTGHRPAGRGWTALMWSALSLGFLTKGPPALLPLAAILPFHLWMRRRARASGSREAADTGPGAPPENGLARGAERRAEPKMITPEGLVLFAGVGLGWFALEAWRHPELVRYFLGVEVWDRLTSNRFSRNPEWFKPLTLYVPALTLGLGPWLAFWPGLGRRLVAEGRRRGARRWLAAHPEAVFLLLWTLVPLAVLFAVPSRLPLYVLPLVAPVALVTARGLVARRPGLGLGEERLGEAAYGARLGTRHGGGAEAAWPGLGRTVWAVAVASAALIVAGKGALAYLPNRHDSRPLAGAMRDVGGPGARFAVCDAADKFGLDFYLAGRVKRVAVRRPFEESFDLDLAGLLAAMGVEAGPIEKGSGGHGEPAQRPRLAGPRSGRWVIALRAASLEPLAEALARAAVPYAVRPGWRRYRLVVVPAGPRAAGDRRRPPSAGRSGA